MILINRTPLRFYNHTHQILFHHIAWERLNFHQVCVFPWNILVLVPEASGKQEDYVECRISGEHLPLKKDHFYLIPCGLPAEYRLTEEITFLTFHFNLELFTKNNIKLLVTVGGDDTASTANRIAKFLAAKHYPIANIHVPKTIDNDLPLPAGSPTFGYQSAKDMGSIIGRTVYTDARTSGNWFVVAAMGRSAGHLAFGIGTACHYPMIVIPEMFNKTEITVEKIVNLVVSSIIKRKIMGIDYGVAMISEGVFHSLSDEEIKKSGIHFSYDDHGHPELGKVSKAHIFNEMLEKKLSELKIKVKSRPVEIGYEVRCQTPVAYDLVYCSLLGMGTYKLFSEGKTGCMVYANPAGEISPLYLKDLQDPETGKIPPRLVDINSDKFTMVIKNILNYLTPEDYEAAKKYIANPEAYDFYKILEWDK